MFLTGGGGVDEIGDALQLHKDKGELVRVGGPKLHKSPPPTPPTPTPRVVLEGLSMWWLMGGAVEWPSPSARRYVMGTRCSLQTANQ